MGVDTEDFLVEVDRGASLRASIRAGVSDLKDHRVLVAMTAVTVLLATLLALLGPLLIEATEAGDVYVTMNSEILVLVDPGMSSGERGDLLTTLSDLDGVSVARESEPEDLEPLPPILLMRFQSGETLVIEPTGRVPVDAVENSLAGVPGVGEAALGLGVPSQWTIDLVELFLPWMAAGFFAAGLLLAATLAFMVAHSRVQEAEAMRLIGADSLSVWIRTGFVVAVPTVLTILLATGIIAIGAPSVANLMLPQGAAMRGATGTILTTGLLLAAAAVVLTSIASFSAVWRVATK